MACTPEFVGRFAHLERRGNDATHVDAIACALADQGRERDETWSPPNRRRLPRRGPEASGDSIRLRHTTRGHTLEGGLQRDDAALILDAGA